MSSRNTLLDPVAAATAVIVGIGAFLLIPGTSAALLAAALIAVLGYAVVLSVRALGRGRAPKPAVGAASDAAAAPRVRRGSAVEVWQQRGHKALAGMQQILATADQPVITGQLENVVIEAQDALPVLDELAAQSAVVQNSVHRFSAARLRDQRASLQAAVQDPTATPEMIADRQRALESVDDQEATLNRLLTVRAGLTTRMESIVLGLERLSAQLSETVATAATPVTAAVTGGEDHLRALGEQLEGLQAGLAESRHYTAQILGPQAE